VRTDSVASLSGLFNPRSVAVVGASATHGKWGNWLALGALAGRGRRAVYLVNSRGGELHGEPAFRSLLDLPEPPEMVVFCIPSGALEETVDAALARNARYLVGITAGLGERGDDGKERERQVVERIRRSGARLLGPNCMGVFDAESALQVTIWEPPRGSIGIISQSGNLSIELGSIAERRGLGFSRVVTVGNQADIEAEEVLDALIEHDGTRAIVCYLESFRDGRRFVASTRAAREIGKPVILITVGGSEASARAARSHTGSLAGDLEIVDAACRAGGILRVASPEQAIQVAQVMLTPGRPPGSRVGIVADGGGHGAVAAELASSHGLSVPLLSDDLSARVAAELPAITSTGNPIDLAGGGDRDIDTYDRVIRHLMASGEVDAVLQTGWFGGYGQYSTDYAEWEMRVVQRLIDACAESQVPLLIHSMSYEAAPAQEFRAHGIPVFASIDGAIRALSMAVQWHQPIHDVLQLPVPAAAVVRDDYWTARQLMSDAGIPFPRAHIATSTEEARQAALELSYPLVIKALGLLHKTDAGGVVLDVRDELQLITAAGQMFTDLSPPAITVEEMAPINDGVEMIVGAKWDRDFGPLLLIGCGGIYAEVFRDFAIALAPLDELTALDLIESLRLAPLLHGVRGQPRLAIERVAEIAARFSSLAAAHPEIVEMEMNPLLVTANDAIALDARVVLARSRSLAPR
jgi:acetate---CoA ligase (ADP-forming)